MKLLVIEDSPADIVVLKTLLADNSDVDEWVSFGTLDEGIRALDSEKPDAVLLDLFLPDSEGLNTFLQLQDHAPALPVVIMTSLDDEQTALRALKNGAQDYLLKNKPDRMALARALRYAVERQSLLHDLECRARELEASETRFRRMIMANPDGLVVVDSFGIARFVNPAAERLLGKDASEVQGRQWPHAIEMERSLELELKHSDDRVIVVESLAAPTTWEGDSATLVTLRVITEHVQLREFLRETAVLDDLTGLYNRRGFMALAQQQLRIADRYHRPVALMNIDVAGMEQINSVLGRADGDRILVEVSHLLVACFRQSDVIARIGGDEFAVLLLETGKEGAQVAVRRLADEVIKARTDGILADTRLTLVVGAAVREAGSKCSLDYLMFQADSARRLQEL